MAFQLPESLPGTTEELTQLRDEAVAAFHEVYTESPSTDEVNELQRIAEAVEAIDKAVSDVKAAAARAEQAAKLADSIVHDPDVDEQKVDEGKTPAQEKASTHTEAASLDETPTDSAPQDADGPHPGAASVKKTAFSKAATGSAPEVPAPERGFRLTTSARNYESGVVDSLRVAREFNALAHGGSARVLGNGGRSETTVATFDRDIPDEFSIGNEAEALAVLERVTDESRLPGGSLVAAGGWCAPSETSYEFLPTESPGDLLSLPEVTVRRGGIRFPVEPDFSTIYSKIGFHHTEAQAQAETEKTCFEIPCAEFEELRLDVQGVCITGGILQDKAWPELTKKFVDEAMRLHAHKVNAFRISKIVEGSTKVTTTQVGVDTTSTVLPVLELQIADMRAKHRLPSTRAVEGIAPVWLINVLRADYAYRVGVLPQQITDAQIREHFRTLGANLQFVGDWQNDVIGTGTTVWPDTVDVVLYTSGTWYSALEPVVSLGVVYDAALLKTNKRIQMFTEDGVAVGKRGPESRIVTIPVSHAGRVGVRMPNPSPTPAVSTTEE